MLDMMLPEENWHIRFLKKKVQELDERQKQGDRDIDWSIDSVISLLVENIGLHQQLDRLEKMLADGYNLYASTHFVKPLFWKDTDPNAK